MRNELKEQSEKVKELNRTKAEIEKLKREKGELKEAADAEAQKRLNETLLQERDKIKMPIPKTISQIRKPYKSALKK